MKPGIELTYYPARETAWVPKESVMVSTYARRDYRTNGAALVISRAEAHEATLLLQEEFKRGAISRDERERAVALLYAQAVPA